MADNSLLVPVDAKTQDWPRKVANAINALLRRRSSPFDMFAAEPTDPTEGMTYYDTTTHKLRVYDGTIWQDGW